MGVLPKQLLDTVGQLSRSGDYSCQSSYWTLLVSSVETEIIPAKVATGHCWSAQQRRRCIPPFYIKKIYNLNGREKCLSLSLRTRNWSYLKQEKSLKDENIINYPLRREDLWRRGVFLLLFTTQELGVVKQNITTSLPHSSQFFRKRDQQGINLLKENETIAHCQTPRRLYRSDQQCITVHNCTVH